MSDFLSSASSTKKVISFKHIVFNLVWGLSLLVFITYLFAIFAYPALLIIALLQLYWSLHCAKLFTQTAKWQVILYLFLGSIALGGSIMVLLNS